MDLIVKSEAFGEGQMIPARYSCDSENISPPIEWENVPAGTASFALICDDPDASMGTFVHWVIYNIPPEARKLNAGIPRKKELPDGSNQGYNSFGQTGYGGPCPPGGTHRYYFNVYALNSMFKAQPDMTKETLVQEMGRHIISKGQLMGRYSR